MKNLAYKTRYVWTVILALALGWLLTSCAHTYTPAQWEAGRMFQRNRVTRKCRHRVALLAQGMIERGDTFDIVIGRSTTSPIRHVWIEQYYEGSVYVLEPSQADWVSNKYHEVSRLRYVPQFSNNANVIKFINCMLKEMGKEAMSEAQIDEE